MDVSYRNSFIGLVVVSSLLLASQPTRRSELARKDSTDAKDDPQAKLPRRNAKHPQGNIFKNYFLIAIAAWLQEIFLHNLYRKDYGLSSDLATTLSVTNLVTAGITSAYVGILADKYGRKATSVVFTACYGASACFSMIPEVPVLFFSRILSGVAAAIMFSVLDSWVVADFFNRKLLHQGCELYRTFGTLGVINAFAAVACGVLGDRLIWATGWNKAPFIVSWLVMWQAMQGVWSTFRESYGASSTDDEELKKNAPTISAVFKRPYMWVLTLAITIFEGTTYLFTFSAVPILQLASRSSKELPLTYIFACIMASALAGSLAFNIIMVRRILRFSRLLTFILIGANFVIWKLSRPKTEPGTFWLLCGFGFLIGLYWPCMGTLRARLIEEGIRSSIYSLMRVPLYIYVVAHLLLTDPAGSPAKVFWMSSMWLTAAFAGAWIITFHKKIP